MCVWSFYNGKETTIHDTYKGYSFAPLYIFIFRIDYKKLAVRLPNF